VAGKHLLLFLLALAAPAASVHAIETASAEVLRAALVFNFIKFTEWPAAAEAPRLRVCIATDDPAQIAALEALDERPIRGTTLVAERYRRQADCSVIYVETRLRWKEIVESNTIGRTLTIGTYAGFVADGGMVEISLQEGSPRFDINLRQAKQTGLRFYPQLLRLARRIVD
jgi:hypothetical protein